MAIQSGEYVSCIVAIVCIILVMVQAFSNNTMSPGVEAENPNEKGLVQHLVETTVVVLSKVIAVHGFWWRSTFLIS